jgi:hypothetical protein
VPAPGSSLAATVGVTVGVTVGDRLCSRVLALTSNEINETNKRGALKVCMIQLLEEYSSKM